MWEIFGSKFSFSKNFFGESGTKSVKQVFIWIYHITAFRTVVGVPVTKLKNLSDVHSILLGSVENDFQLVIQKESYKIASDL